LTVNRNKREGYNFSARAGEVCFTIFCLVRPASYSSGSEYPGPSPTPKLDIEIGNDESLGFRNEPNIGSDLLGVELPRGNLLTPDPAVSKGRRGRLMSLKIRFHM
jgi:hypothetical protein